MLAFIVKEDYALRLLTSNLTGDTTQTAHIFFSTTCILFEIEAEFSSSSPTATAFRRVPKRVSTNNRSSQPYYETNWRSFYTN